MAWASRIGHVSTLFLGLWEDLAASNSRWWCYYLGTIVPQASCGGVVRNYRAEVIKSRKTMVFYRFATGWKPCRIEENLYNE
jgi:hypothetical protein